MSRPPTGYPPIADLVPHGPAMRMLDRLLEWSPGFARVSMQVDAASKLVVDGRLDGVLLLEPLAQAVACCLGYEAFRRGDGVRPGMVVACRALETRVAAVDVGTRLELVVTRVRGNDATSHFDCEAWRGEERIATAALTLVHARA